MSSARINGADRLAGDAKFVSVCRTVELQVLGFTVWSKNGQCAAADIRPDVNGQPIYGVLYEVPEFLVARPTACARNRKSLDEIEAEGTNYVRQKIRLIDSKNIELVAMTYVVRVRREGLRTSIDYVEHIFRGIQEHGVPDDYRRYVVACVLQNNEQLAHDLRVRGYA